MAAAPQDSPATLLSLKHLDAERLSVVTLALENILSLPDVELTYAQIVDGLPLRKVYVESRGFVPTIVSEHESLCDGALDRVRDARSKLDMNTLFFPQTALERYAHARAGSVAFCLCLLELLAVACHQIGATLYEWSDADALHSRASVLAAIGHELDANRRNRVFHPSNLPKHTHFYHHSYIYQDQYPRGVADMVGYWAETRIFGGVAVFDRGRSGDANGGVYFHSDRHSYGTSLYPPTEDQLKALMAFFTSTTVTATATATAAALPPEACPLPVVSTSANRWRWDAGFAFLHWNIFRDRYERNVSPTYRPYRHKMPASTWPEVGDDNEIFRQFVIEHDGLEPVDHAAIATAKENLKKITPTSPKWRGPMPSMDEPNPPWKPPYYHDLARQLE
ncbi:hypothetical protein SPBR_02878 [Sporothrix brasiliensis 5110]|uniref:Uncharacterized protein n=1 Tax=Sporothrix brasiliensis 5110 TaxID=1398154 RepID=A0A0C2FQ68_9PEZI|nr:uncharacterized protein SPBR_02878 [Sporothrix brasiliensis 5110]KIH93158.1 hypothetical protein SPBR_02878 [Sporothrix brasiliensis 5110]